MGRRAQANTEMCLETANGTGHTGASSPADLKFYFALLTEEYRSLRSESMQASVNMFSAYKWGATAVGVIIGAGLTQWNEKHSIVLLVFFVLVPAISCMSMLIWLGEATRMKRAGDYICLIEEKASLLLKEFKRQYNLKCKWDRRSDEIQKDLLMSPSELDLSDPLVWERWLREGRERGFARGHQMGFYLIRLGFFPAVMTSSLAIASYYALGHARYSAAFGVGAESVILTVEARTLLLFCVSVGLAAFAWITAYGTAKDLMAKQRVGTSRRAR